MHNETAWKVLEYDFGKGERNPACTVCWYIAEWYMSDRGSNAWHAMGTAYSVRGMDVLLNVIGCERGTDTNKYSHWKYEKADNYLHFNGCLFFHQRCTVLLFCFLSHSSEILAHTCIIIANAAFLLSKTKKVRFKQQSWVKQGEAERKKERERKACHLVVSWSQPRARLADVKGCPAVI